MIYGRFQKMPNFPAIIFPLTTYYGKKENLGNVFQKYLNYFIAVQNPAWFWAQKNRKPFLDFLSWYAVLCGGVYSVLGYSVIIPRKQTCSPRLKRSLCKWACRCPALSFSVDCISHLPRLTGSFRFPGSTRLQRFAPL